MRFRDRVDAGRQLAERLGALRGEDVVVLGLPRGGVPVAFEVAHALGAPLDVVVVRKLGVPFQPELGMGAVGEDGVRVLNPEVVRLSGVDDSELAELERRERAELERRAERFRGSQPRRSVAGRTAVIVDDGIATGSTARAACEVARAHGAVRVVLAVPVLPRSVLAELYGVADEVVYVRSPEPFFAVGRWYKDFAQTTDAEVVSLLSRAASASAGAAADPGGWTRDEEVSMRVQSAELAGHLAVPSLGRGTVIFVHGSGSSRHSPRNRYVAGVLGDAGLATLLCDLLTPDEELDRDRVFDIPLLTDRLEEVTRWVRAQPELTGTRVGYFGASTGAGAALCAAARPGAGVAAVVSRGGRPDLAGELLGDVRVPTLLIVGGRDETVLELNRQARARLACDRDLVVVPGATHLFEEPGALEEVARLARDWFLRHLAGPGRGAEDH